MNCSSCGSRLDNSDTFCPVCGRSISTAEAAYVKKVEFIEGYSDTMEFDKNTSFELSRDEISTTAPPEYSDRSKKEKRPRPVLVGLLITVLVIGAVAFAAYYAYTYFMGDTTNEYISSISKISSQIEKVNEDIADILKKSSSVLPVSDILSKMPSTYDSLNKIDDDINSITVPATYSSAHDKLREAVKLNKQLYQQLEGILKNPTSPDTQKNMEALGKSIDQCMSGYTSVSIKNLNFTLPNEIIGITSKIQPWVKQKQTEYDQVSKLIASFSKYFEDMSKIILSYDNSKVDFSQALKTARADNTSWTILFEKISTSEKVINDIKGNYAKVSVPSQLKEFNKSFQPILDDTLAYCSKLKLAAEAEKNFKKEGMLPEAIKKRTDEIEALYKDAELSNTSSVTGYQKFSRDISAEKDNYMNPEFVMKLKK